MKDIKAQLERLRIQIAECELIRDLATDPSKRELFARLADQFNILAADVERTMAAGTPRDTLLGPTQEPSPKEGE